NRVGVGDPRKHRIGVCDRIGGVDGVLLLRRAARDKRREAVEESLAMTSGHWAHHVVINI
ncbi:hypothetical protein, partial [Mycobacterium sp.]|uniref:hypothetical protein n=1 Tax=Mycobacterium sp. TaxID=1785 RepID=UPI002DA157A8|nr:hypothetical protein [Mycobacterium sp.]